MSQKLQSGIIVSDHVARELHAKLHNGFIKHEFAREYVPGGAKHYGDDRVSSLNHELDALNDKLVADGVKQKLFAVWHDMERLSEGRLWGVVVWALNEDGTAKPNGNPSTKPAEGHTQQGLPDKEAILHWFSSLASLPLKLRSEAKARYDELTGKTAIDKKLEAAREEQKEALSDTILTKTFDNKPTRSDRTIPENAGGTKESADRKLGQSIHDQRAKRGNKN